MRRSPRWFASLSIAVAVLAVAPPPTAAAPAPVPASAPAPAPPADTTPALAAAQAAPAVVVAAGAATHWGDPAGTLLNGPLNDIVGTATGRGYWLLAADGGVFAYGDAGFFGSMGGQPLNDRVISLAPTPSGRGYWFVARDGGMFSFGDAGFFGSMGGRPLNQPVVGMVPTRTGRGYWLVAADGGVFAFGDAGFVGSLGGDPPDQPVVGLAATPDGRGYWMVDRAGQVYAFGSARRLGWVASNDVAAVDIVGTPSGLGYWVLRVDGRLEAYGDARSFSARPPIGPGQRAVGVAVTPDGTGVWVSSTGRFATAAAPGGSPFAVLRTTRGVVRFDPCAGPIGWWYNPAGAPSGASVEFMAAAMAFLGQVTGFSFEYRGTTTSRPLAYRDNGIVLGWDVYARGVLGQGGGNILSGPFGVVRTAGGVALNAALDEPFEWSRGWGPVLLHELGHALGLEHVDDPEQLMYDLRSYPTTFMAGDLAGLWAVGPAQGCVR